MGVETNAFGKFYRGRLLGDEGVWSMFEEESIALLAVHHSTQASAAFKYHDLKWCCAGAVAFGQLTGY